MHFHFETMLILLVVRLTRNPYRDFQKLLHDHNLRLGILFCATSAALGHTSPRCIDDAECLTKYSQVLSNNMSWDQVCFPRVSKVASRKYTNYCTANYVTKIPESLESADAAPMLCAGVTVYSALRKSGAKSGDWIALLGAGGGVCIGHSTFSQKNR